MTHKQAWALGAVFVGGFGLSLTSPNVGQVRGWLVSTLWDRVVTATEEKDEDVRLLGGLISRLRVFWP
jgi:hypothetical protein